MPNQLTTATIATFPGSIPTAQANASFLISTIRCCCRASVTTIVMVTSVLATNVSAQLVRTPETIPYFCAVKMSKAGNIVVEQVEFADVQKDGPYEVEIPYTVEFRMENGGTASEVRIHKETRNGPHTASVKSYTYLEHSPDEVRTFEVIDIHRTPVQIDSKRLSESLSKPRPALIVFKGERVDPFFLQLVRQGTLIMEVEPPPVVLSGPIPGSATDSIRPIVLPTPE